MFTRFAAKASIAAFAAVLFVQTPAFAQEPMSRSVRYADLDLTTADGAARLKQRVNRAAAAVCGGSQRASLSEVAHRNECRVGAIASAEPQMQILFAQAASGTRLADASALTVASAN